MQRYVAFLGGINVGGHRVTGDALRSLFEGLGFTDVATFLASGNVVFTTDDGSVQDLRSRIESHLEAELGYAVPTFLRSEQEVLRIAAHEPFPPEMVAASFGKLQVGLLADPPDEQGRATVLALSDEQDRLALDGTELYWLPSGGISQSPLDLTTIYRAIGPMTLRTVNTVRRIARKYFGA